MTESQLPNTNDTETENTMAISMRNVDKEAWHNFKRLAVIHDMSIQEYLKFLVEKEMVDAPLNSKRK